MDTQSPVGDSKARLAALPGRAVLAVSGADRVTFLNGLVSNDIATAAPGQAVWAALLTPQGKWLADFFVFATAEALLLDCEAERLPLLRERLARFRLRAAVTLEPAPLLVHAAWGVLPAVDGLVAADPRLPEAGWRILAAAPLATNASAGDYDAHRLALGLPDGERDLEPEKSILLEAGFDELNGVSWTKGCYLGQELTARTRWRGLVKRRLLPVSGQAPMPVPGTPVMLDERDVGTMRSSAGAAGLAVLRLDALGAGTLTCGGVALTPRVPAWVRLPAQAEEG
jgi:folate-binding protein YgfZ